MNKHRWGIALVLVALMLISLSPLAAQEGAVSIPATVSVYQVQVRVLPNVSFESVFRLVNGDAVTLIGRTRANTVNAVTWVQVVNADGLIGWANTRAFTFEGDVLTLPVTVPSADQGVVIGFASLRTTPDLNSETTGTRLTTGAVVDVVATEATGEWLFVRAADGASGWVRPDALTYMSGSLPEDLFITNATVAPQQAVATVNFRVAPSADAALRGFGPVGLRVQVIGISQDGGWYRIVPVDTRVPAWVRADLLALDATVENLPVLDAEGNPAAAAEEVPAEEAPAAETAPAQ